MRTTLNTTVLALLLAASAAPWIPAQVPNPGPVQVPVQAPARDPAPPDTVTTVLNPWLLAGPMNAPPPAFHDDGEPETRIMKESFLEMDRVRPEEGGTLGWPGGEAYRWRQVEADDKVLRIEPRDDTGTTRPPAVAYLAGYLETNRRMELEITLESHHPVALYCHGTCRGKGEKSDKNGVLRKTKVKLDLATGKHCLVVKTACSRPAPKTGWLLRVGITPPEGTAEKDMPRWSIQPEHTFARIDEITALESVSALALSEDGRHLAVQRSAYTDRKGGRTTWIELLNTERGDRVQTLRLGRSIRSPVWRPGRDQLTVRSGSSLWTYSVSDRSFKEILSDEKGLGSYFWSPDGRYLYFTATSSEAEKGDFERVRDPRYRLTDWVEGKELHVLDVEGGSRRTLAAKGTFAFLEGAVSPDGSRLALVRRLPIPERPFFETEFWVMDLPSQATTLLKKVRFPFENPAAHLTWCPESRCIAFTGPPGETFLPGQGPEHNAFDNCLWVLDSKTGDLVRLSDRFGESVAGGLWWSPRDGKIHFIAQQRAFQRIARIDPSSEDGIEFLTEHPSVVSLMAPSLDGTRMAFAGSSLDQPVQVHLLNLDRGTFSLLLDPNAAYMEGMMLGPWERFDFVNGDGDPIDGWIFHPPHFDEGKTYPLIVYYYGGVSPRQERFSVLTTHWLTANGYVVYQVNPTGAVGHTHAFADKHCNDQGEVAGRDILEGLERVLKAKPYIDEKRIACYGGSYGGFMTMSLITRTDRFRAACSLYGIANIASYWGGGIWGYTYGDTAVAGSYPWSRRDIFVERSPLYHADKIRTPLLLLHGVSDVNVPSIESEQMFTALKVLGKDVAYVRFEGEDHGISGKFSNLIAHRSMMLEWFDKHLKEQPEGWERRWKK